MLIDGMSWRFHASDVNLMFLGNRGACVLRHTQRGQDADDFEATCSVHFQSFWQLREWAVTENMKLFALTEKAFNVYFVIRVSFLTVILEGLIESSGKRLRAWVRGIRIGRLSYLVRHIVACTLLCSAVRSILACAGVFQVSPSWVSAAAWRWLATKRLATGIQPSRVIILLSGIWQLCI